MFFNNMHVRGVTIAALLLPVTVQSQRGSEGPHEDKRHLDILKREPIERAYCVDPNMEFDTEVVVSFKGMSGLLSSSDYMEMEDSFREAYNSVRREFCDDRSRQVVDASVDDNSLEKKSSKEFSMRFKVKVGCDRCGTNTDLFHFENFRRELSAKDESDLFEKTLALLDETDYDNSDSTELRSLPQSPRGDTLTRATNLRPPLTRAIILRPFFGAGAPLSNAAPPTNAAPPVNAATPMDDESECCPPGGESRGPTGSEFAQAFDKAYKKVMGSARKLQGVPIEQVLAAFEVSAIDCPESVEEFESIVFVDLGLSGDPLAVLESEIAALENGFQVSYNSYVKSQLCDPYFRSVATAAIENEEGQRRLQSSSSRYKYKVLGRCRGCGNLNKRLFGEGSGRRELASPLQMLYHRELQFVSSDNTCYCAVGTEEKGITETEFTGAYDAVVQDLRRAGVLKNVESVLGTEEDVPPTWSPTTSPTNYPTAPTDSPVPSPSPSVSPTV